MTILRRKNKQLWQKIGGGSFYMGNKIIKPGQKFRASADEIPLTMRDLVMSVEEEEPKLKKEPKEVKNEVKKKEASMNELEKELREFEEEQNVGKYFIEPIDKGRNNVIDWNGKIMNEEPLSTKSAEALVKRLKK